MRGDGRPVIAPTLEDPLVRGASAVVGGPTGVHTRPGGSWWTPVRVVLAVVTVTFLLGMLQKTPCENADWQNADGRFSHMCYSDIAYLYSGRGLAERIVPYTDTGGRYPALEYPVLTGYFAYGAALATQAVTGWPNVSVRAQVPADQVAAQPGVEHEATVYFAVTAVGLFVCALVAAGLLAGAQLRRPWDAVGFAAAPVLLLAGTINWDLLAVAFLAGALYAWSRQRPGWAGVMIGLGTAAKLFPLFLLGVLLVLCIRSRRLSVWASTAVAAVTAWLVVDLPAMVLDPDQWVAFWRFNADRGADLGSVWLLAQQAGATVSPDLINTVSWAFFGAVCVGAAALALGAHRRPRVPALLLLVLIGFLLVNKVYSPQYVLWLLPVAVLARPRWRDLLIWQACEVFYFGAVWLYLGTMTAPAVSGQPDRFYWVAIGVRMVGQLYLAAMVVRDIVYPWHDPVRADGITDDPAGGPLDESAFPIGPTGRPALSYAPRTPG